MLGVDDGFVVTDNGVNVLEEHDPGHNRMGEACLARFFVMFAKVSRGVKEFFRKNGGLQLDFSGLVDDRLTMDTADVAAAHLCEFKGLAGGLETGVAAFEESTHV